MTVIVDLKVQAKEGGEVERKSFHLKDGIDWEAISARVVTRNSKQCMSKWYEQLRPSMRETGEWSAGQDTQLAEASGLCVPSFP
jgi:hypothetical protein